MTPTIVSMSEPGAPSHLCRRAMEGSWYHYTLYNGGIIRRLRAKSLPMLDDVIARLNLMASTDGAVAKGTVKRGKCPEFVSRWTSEHEEYESLLEAPTPSLQ